VFTDWNVATALRSGVVQMRCRCLLQLFVFGVIGVLHRGDYINIKLRVISLRVVRREINARHALRKNLQRVLA